MAFPYGSIVDGYLTEFLSYYNGNAYDAGTNPGGLAAGGHRTNFIPILQKYSTIASSVADAANYAATQATNASTSATTASNAATALSGTSTTSVTIGAGSKSFTTQTGKSFNTGTFVMVVSDASPTTHYMLGQVTSYASGTGALAISVATGAFGGSGSRADWSIYGRAGTQGIAGAAGATGAQGVTPTLQWNFSSTTTDSDPGGGLFRINNATYGSATFLYFDNLDRNAADQTSWLDSLDDSTSSVNRGTLFLQEIATPGTYAIFYVGGSPGTVEDGTGYRKVPVVPVMSLGTFTPGNAVAVAFYRSGDKGTDGAGSGDVISDIGSSTVGRVAIYNSTDGKHITQSSFTIGTSGTAIGALSTANTWGAAQSFAGLVDMQQNVQRSGDITPAQITGNVDDYAPTGLATASVLRLNTDASHNLTGLTGGADGREIDIINVGSNALVLKHLTTSTAANQFDIGSDITLLGSMGISLWYDSTSSKWRPKTVMPFNIGAAKTIFASNGATALPTFRTAANLSLLEKDVTSTISVGYTVTPATLGTMTNFTINPALGNYQYGTNNGAFTLTAPASDCAIDLLVTNGATAGSITFAGFTVNSNIGEPLTSINGNKFIISIRRINAVATYMIKALQ